MIDKTAIIDSKAKLDKNVKVGPYCVIGPNVEIGENTIIQSHVNISGNVKIGKENKIYPFVSINDPQDLKYGGEPTNLIIGDNATVNSKPQLEIFADDVKCSHGCTIGQIDENALFYLKTRGINDNDAKGLLTYAFANNVLENVGMQVLKTKIKKIIARKIGINIGLEL